MNTQNTSNLIDLQRIGLWVGALVLIVDSICLMVVGEIVFILATGLLLGLSLISLNLWPYIGMKKPFRDERAARAGAMAGITAWYISLIAAVVGAIIVSYLPALWNISLNASQALGGIIVVMVITMVCVYEYMNWKGVTE